MWLHILAFLTACASIGFLICGLFGSKIRVARLWPFFGLKNKGFLFVVSNPN